MKLRYQLAEVQQDEERYPEEYVQFLKDLLESIESASDIVDKSNEMKPFRLFGFKAELSVVMWLVTSAGTYFFLLLTMYSSSYSNL